MFDGLHKVHNDTLDGLTAPITFGSGLPRSSGCVYFELLTQKGWTAPLGVKPICR